MALRPAQVKCTITGLATELNKLFLRQSDDTIAIHTCVNP